MIINGINYSNLPQIDPQRFERTTASSRSPTLLAGFYSTVHLVSFEGHPAILKTPLMGALLEMPPRIAMQSPSPESPYTLPTPISTSTNNAAMAQYEARKTESQKSIENEARIRSQLPGDETASHLIKCYGATAYINSGLVFEYAPHGTLEQYLKKEASSEIKRLQLAIDVLSALMFLHHNKIIFVDLHEKNVLIDSDRHAKLCDLGAAHQLVGENKTVQSDNIQVKTSWGAPESLHPNNTVSAQSDLYTFGILLEFFYSQQYPAEYIQVDQQGNAVYPQTEDEKLTHNQRRNNAKQAISHPTVKALALNLCSLYAKDRPDAQHAKAVLNIARTDLQADFAQTRVRKKRSHSDI